MKNKTFTEIWKGLNKNDRGNLRIEIITRTRITDMGLNAWTSGRRNPSRYTDQKAVAESVNKVLGIEAKVEELFPKV